MAHAPWPARSAADNSLRTMVIAERAKGGAEKLAFRERDVSRVVIATALECGVRAESMRNMEAQDTEVVAARWTAWHVLHKLYPAYSLASLARLWPCHHTTILHALNRTVPKKPGPKRKA